MRGGAVVAHEVFISHASGDAELAGAVHDALESGGCECWMARTDVEPGADFAESITEAIGAARVLVVLLTAESIKSRHVRREVGLADSESKAILLVRVEDTPLAPWVKYHSEGNQWLDVFGEKSAARARRVAEAVKKLVGSPRRSELSGAAGGATSKSDQGEAAPERLKEAKESKGHGGASKPVDGSGAGDLSREVVVVVPELGEGVHEAVVARWLVRVGQEVKEKQPLAEVETDKAIIEVPSPCAGVVVKLHGVQGKVIPAGSPLVQLSPDRARGFRGAG